jgi:signal transduction histidine kinase/integral membrane sensor domain MASE1
MPIGAGEVGSSWKAWPPGGARSGLLWRSDRFSPRYLLAAALLAVSYYVGVHAGFALTAHHSAVSLLWPPNAIVLSALLLTPKHVWPLLIAAVLPAHLLAQVSANVPFAMILCWYVSNMFEALIGAWSIRRLLGYAPPFVRFRELMVFLLCGGFLAPFVSSFLDAGFVAWVGWRYDEYWQVWRTRFLSNVLANLMLVPLIVIWFRRGLAPLRQLTFAQLVEAGVLLTGLVLTSALVFLQQGTDRQALTMLYLPLPFLLWAAMRLDMGGVSLCVATVASLAITGVLQGYGPFSSGEPDSNAQAVQVFLIIATTSLMLQSVSLAELRGARQEAVRQKERLQLALKAARMGTWDWDVGSDRVVWSVAEDAEPSGLDLGATTLAGGMQHIHADDRTRASDALTQALAGTNDVEIEFRWVDGDQTRWIVAKGKLDTEGPEQRVLGVHMDVTQRKAQDLQMQQQRNQLAHLSRVAVLGELSGALAHELNQPLTAIMTNAQAARRALHAEQPTLDLVDEALTDIIAEDKRAADVIRRLRALFLKGEIELEELNVNDCVHEVLALERSDLISRRVTVEACLADDLPLVRADRVQMQQVLLNLIGNACDAMLENALGDRRLQIVTRREGEEAVAIEIIDCGTGIADANSIFEPFFTTKDSGLGLGLAICQTIIRMHRGRLWATNNDARGATLHIRLPHIGWWRADEAPS